MDDVNYKIFKVYGILDDLLNKYKNDKEFGNALKNPFKVIINIKIEYEFKHRAASENWKR